MIKLVDHIPIEIYKRDVIMKYLGILATVLVITNCKGNSDGGHSFNSGNNSGAISPTTPPSAMETQKLVSAIQATPAYKIEDSEIALLKSEGVITDQDKIQLQAIQ